jgi:hypothetical protein
MQQINFETLSNQARVTIDQTLQIWNAAAQFDNSLAIKPTLAAALARKKLEPTLYSRSKLFDRMVLCEASLFNNYPVQRFNDRNKAISVNRLVEEIRSGFPKSKRARVRVNGTVDYLPIPRVLNKWDRAQSVFGVTDLHYIGLRFDSHVDTKALNDFNVLPRGAYGYESQDSLVISSAGAVTDSHSDDHSGSNHCFTGAKLWLLWDTFEGFKYGLEDQTHCRVFDRAAFDVAALAAMKTSRWILIGPGQTMFIPANLTHKVITLEKYLGLGSFHAGLPGFVDLLLHWHRLPPLWVSSRDHRCSVEFITRRAIRKIRSLQNSGRGDQFRWGMPYLKARLVRPDLMERSGRARIFSGNDNLRAFVTAAERLARAEG